MIDLKNLSEEEVLSFIKELGLPPYRARQLLHWIYEQNITDINNITEFSKDLRSRLSALAFIGTLSLVSSQQSVDGTTKYLFELGDGEQIESVLISDGERLTLCLSSQVGCAMACTFCLTGTIGFRRNLRASEIIDQILFVNRAIAPARVTNIVFMGMGEPLNNLKELCRAIVMIINYVKISKRRITVSTSGIPHKILELSRCAPLVNLAVSLNAPDDTTRSRIMPVNRTYNLERLLAACRTFPLSRGRRITFEYVLIKNVNDSLDQARLTAERLKGIPSKVNLIPFNPAPGISLESPGQERIMAFQKILHDKGIAAIIRKSKGADIMAACGQLRGHYSTKKNSINLKNR